MDKFKENRHLIDSRWGHTTQSTMGTGVTVLLFDAPVPCGFFVPGAAPLGRDITLLDSTSTVPFIDALVFAGGGSYGLGTTNGVMQWLYERGRGYRSFGNKIPIVPTVCLSDLSEGHIAFPDPEDAYLACQSAQKENLLAGQIGAATGSTVGKGIKATVPDKGGFAQVLQMSRSGIWVMAFAVVNSIGDVFDEQHHLVAGARLEDGHFANIGQCLANGYALQALPASCTTLVAIITNGHFQKPALTRIAKMASAGIARSIVPAFTAYDGDIIFAVSVGHKSGDEVTTGCLAAQATQQAIIKAVRQ